MTDENPDVRMVERAIEGEAEADAQAQEDAEEAHCDDAARNALDHCMNEKGWLDYNEADDYENVVAFLADEIQEERRLARLDASPTHGIGEDDGHRACRGCGNDITDFPAGATRCGALECGGELNPLTAPMAEVDAEIRANGGDPDCISRGGELLVDALLRVRRLTEYARRLDGALREAGFVGVADVLKAELS